ncbi:TonB-dependent receptor [Carboxylicivirga mesophila]|uniref:TonB-dependent receptor n=1 Tax=Carboxylicivirga mesophila TaxID=1166478 RepID=A0ABS5KCD2_9BACT|nr:TonB-dependent receptor [Carboxylicivirga mesophila]MBS2212700.1 TonB-dependent receptor [Carboxylicivirga mesophila]
MKNWRIIKPPIDREARKLLRVMKILSILLLAFSLHLTAGVSAQGNKISLKVNNASIVDVLEDIESQSSFRFVFSSDLGDLSRKVTMNIHQEEMMNVLDEVLKGSEFIYRIQDDFIIFLPKENNEIIINAQQVSVTVKGIVTDSNGEPIPGANIFEQANRMNGVITGFDGSYSIEISSGETALTFSFIGFNTQTVQVANRKTINVTLVEEATGLDEVVVVGYGTQKKANLTGAVESVMPEGLQSRPLTNTSAALQGQVAGAFISQTSGQPGNDDAQILIRGIGTFGNSKPLVIIDGMVGDLADVNPKDLENISILKDAASTAIYGNRASNGVILITTKKGKSGQMKVDYKGYAGVQQVTEMPDILKGVEYLELRAQAEANSNNGQYPTWYNDEYMYNYRNNVDPMMYPTDYDWISDTFRSAAIYDNHVNISGGSDNLLYSVSVGYLNQDGIVDGNDTKKLTIRSNFSSYFFKDKLRLDLNLSGYDQITNDVVAGMDNAIYNVYVAPSTVRKYIPTVGYTGYGSNWAAKEEGGYRQTKSTPINVRMAASLEVVKGLKIDASYNLYSSSNELEIWNPSLTFYALQDNGQLLENTPTQAILENYRETSLTKMADSQINYSSKIGESIDFNALAGFEARELSYKQYSMSRTNFPVNVPSMGIGDPATQKNGSSAYEGSWLSYYGRLNFNILNKYMLEATLRKDGSSRFEDKWGTFPSTSIGWRVSEESFLESADWLANLKLRASWGQLGNEAIGDYYAASNRMSSNLTYNFNNTLYSAAAITRLADRSTSWETSEQLNLGFDIGLIRNKITATFDYFVKTNKDILMQLPVSGTLGLSEAPFVNAAAMENRGVEMMATYVGKYKELDIKASITASSTTNEITDLGGQDFIIFDNNLMWEVGKPFNSFYGFKTEGLYRSQDEIDNHLNSEIGTAYAGMVAQPGDIRFADLNGDGVITADDRTILGKPYPDWVFSSNLDLGWRNWDLGLFFQGVFGVNSLNQGMITAPFHGGAAATGAWYRDAWSEDNPDSNIQRLYSEPNRFNIVSDYYMEDASYLRLKNVTIGYTIPKRLLEGIGVSHVRVYGNIQNALTWTKMRYGFDPEKPSTTTNTLQYPQTRIFSMGVNIKF